MTWNKYFPVAMGAVAGKPGMVLSLPDVPGPRPTRANLTFPGGGYRPGQRADAQRGIKVSDYLVPETPFAKVERAGLE